jgi:hypothetical protein
MLRAWKMHNQAIYSHVITQNFLEPTNTASSQANSLLCATFECHFCTKLFQPSLAWSETQNRRNEKDKKKSEFNHSIPYDKKTR